MAPQKTSRNKKHTAKIRELLDAIDRMEADDQHEAVRLAALVTYELQHMLARRQKTDNRNDQ